MRENDSQEKGDQNKKFSPKAESKIATASADIWGDKPPTPDEKEARKAKADIGAVSETSKSTNLNEKLVALNNKLHATGEPLFAHPNLTVIGVGAKGSVILEEKSEIGKASLKLMVNIDTGEILAKSQSDAGGKWEKEPIDPDGKSKTNLQDLQLPRAEKGQIDSNERVEKRVETFDYLAKTDIQNLVVMPGISENFEKEMTAVIKERIPQSLLTMVSENVYGFKIVLQSIESPGLIAKLPENDAALFNRILGQEKIFNGEKVATDSRRVEDLGGKYVAPYVVIMEQTQRERNLKKVEYERPTTLLHEFGHATDQALAKVMRLKERSFSDSSVFKEAWKSDLEQQLILKGGSTWTQKESEYYEKTDHFRKQPSEAVAEAVFSLLNQKHADSITEKWEREKIEAFKTLFPNSYKLVQEALAPYLKEPS